MKINKNRSIYHISGRIFSLVLVAVLATGLIPPRAVFADANILSITPSTSQMNIGTTFTVNVRSYADTSQTIGSAGGTVNYLSSMLQVTGISVSGSGYGSPSITQGASSIGFSASRNPAPSGSTQLFAITFQAKSAGTALVSFSDDSKINGGTTTYKTGVFTITNPNPSNPSPSSTPKQSTVPVPVISAPTPTQTNAPTESDTNVVPTPDPTGLIDGVLVLPSYTSSTISWKVNATNPSSTFSYGTSPTQLDKTATVQKKPDGTFSATVTGLTPGLRYNFAIQASGTGTSGGNYSSSMITQGFPIVLTITENNTVVKSGQVKIGSHSYNILNGKVSIGLAAGSYNGTITTDTATLAISLTVQTKPVASDNSAPELQKFGPFNLTSSSLEGGPGTQFSILTFVAALVIGTIVLGVVAVVFIRFKRRDFNSDGPSYTSTSSSTVVIDDGYSWKHDDEAANTEPEQVDEVITPQPTNPNLEIERPRHANSVYITEEEPLDMFDKAKIPAPSDDPTTSPLDETPQNPSSPHSTTP